MPPFDPEGGLALILLRGAAVASLLSAFGTLVFGVAVAPRAFAGAAAEVTEPAWRALTRLCRVSLLASFAFAVVWLVAESGQLAGASGLVATLHAVPTVLSGTVFGQALALRLIALGAVFAVLGRRPSVPRWRAATVLCGAALCLHAAHSHAMAMVHGPSVLLATQVLHLLAAGAWLGGLLPLLLVVRLDAAADRGRCVPLVLAARQMVHRRHRGLGDLAVLQPDRRPGGDDRHRAWLDGWGQDAASRSSCWALPSLTATGLRPRCAAPIR